MSEKLVNVCDVDGFCRRLADANCIICNVDACMDHLKCRLYIRIGTTSPVAHNDTTKFAVPIAAEEHNTGICEKCAVSAAELMFKAGQQTGRRGGDIKMTAENMNLSMHKPSWAAVFKVMMDEMMKRTAEELRVADAQIRLGGKPGSDT